MPPESSVLDPTSIALYNQNQTLTTQHDLHRRRLTSNGGEQPPMDEVCSSGVSLSTSCMYLPYPQVRTLSHQITLLFSNLNSLHS